MVVLLKAFIYSYRHKIFICMYSIYYTVETDYSVGKMETLSEYSLILYVDSMMLSTCTCSNLMWNDQVNLTNIT